MPDVQNDLRTFDIGSLERAVERIAKALRIAGSRHAEDPELAEEFRQSTIRTFEYTYELAIRTLLRFMGYLPSVGDPDKLSFSQAYPHRTRARGPRREP